MTVEGVLLDIDGVLVVSWEPLPGAVEAIEELRRRELPLRLVTNTTTRTRDAVVEALGDAGIDVGPDEVLTAPRATADWVREHHPGAKVFLLNSGDVGAEFDGIELVEETADVVVIGGAGESFTYERLNLAFQLVLDGADLVGMHRNLSWRTSRGMELDTGAFLGGIEAAADVEATVVGKPSAAFFSTALRSLGTTAAHAVMVGDDLHNDVLAAQACGIDAALVRTGKFRDEVLERAERAGDHPGFVLDGIGSLPALLDELDSLDDA